MARSRRSWLPFSTVVAVVLTDAAPAPAQRPAWASLRTAPGARTRHALAFDGARGRAVLFGGWQTGIGNLGDTWEWDGVAWIRRTPANAPPARAGHAMAFDPARGVTVLFGGGAVGLLDDTWEWDGDDWRHVVVANPPPPLEQPALAWHGGGHPGILMHGGRTAFGPIGDTWRFDGTD